MMEDPRRIKAQDMDWIIMSTLKMRLGWAGLEMRAMVEQVSSKSQMRSQQEV